MSDAVEIKCEKVGAQSLIDRQRLERLVSVSRTALSLKLKGDVAEVGVYKGGSALTLAEAFDSSKKTLYLFDTFEGIPYSDSRIDGHKQGDFNDVSFESTTKLFADYEAEIRKGIFPKTTQGLENKLFCCVHIDTDVYQSIKDCIEFFYPRLVDGGFLVFDDWEWQYCRGVKKAIEEYFGDRIEKPLGFHMQCVIQKGREIPEISK